MKNLFLSSIFFLGVAFLSCKKSTCKECSSCKTKATATLCEDNFQTKSDYNDQVANYESDGCACKNK